MKTFFKFNLTLLIVFIVSINSIFGQKTVNLITDGAAVSGDIDEQLKADIFDVVQDVLNKYYNIASFWDENAESFDEEKYSQYIGLFSGSARVYDDIADKPTNIEYSTYADNVFQYMQEEGVQFILENVYLNSLERDESGFYVANLDMDKIVYVGLDKDNFPVKFGDGNRYTLNVQIDMPDYDINVPKIQSITGEEAAKRVQTPAYLTGNFSYGLGSFIEGDANAIGASFNNFTSKSASTLGFHLLMRKALNPAELIWYHIGVGAQQHSLKTGYNNFNNSGLPGEETSRSEFKGAFVNAETPVPYTTENGTTLLGNVTINNIEDSQELLNVITIDVPIGITFRARKTYKSRVFIDLSIVPSYSISSSGSSTGKPEGFIIPDSEHFPSVESILEQSDGQERLDNYTFGDEEFEYTDNDISVGNNFGLGVQLSPTYMYDINFKYGVEIGVNLWYNVLSVLGNNNSTEGYLKSQYANKSFGTKSSILEDYYSGVNPFYASLKIGFFYKIN